MFSQMDKFKDDKLIDEKTMKKLKEISKDQ